MKIILTAFLSILAAFSTGCVPRPAHISFNPIPYDMRIPSDIASRLSVQPMTGDWVEHMTKAGVVAAVMIQYESDDGKKHGFAAVYYTPQERFDAAKNPNEPPMFGEEVSRSNGFVLSVAGPHDTIFEPLTSDGRNIVRLCEGLSRADTYVERREG